MSRSSPGRATTTKIEAEKSYKEILRRAAKEIVAFGVFFLTDSVKAALIISVLYLLGQVLQFFRLAGVDENDLYYFDRLHYWLSCAAYFILGVWFLARLIRFMWREFRAS